MVWVKLDDGFVENEKVCELHDRSFRLHVAGICYSARNLTDGLITTRAEKVLGAVLNFQTKRWTAELVSVGLWTKVDGGHQINDYLEYNPSAQDVKAERRRNAERQADLRRRRNETRHDVDNALRNEGSNGSPSQPVPLVTPVLAIQRPPRYEGTDSSPLGRLKDACRTDHDGVVKLNRAAKGCTDADVIAALEACKGPGVRDRLAVALSELKKRKEAA